MEQDVQTGYRPMCSACLSCDRDLFDLNSSTQVYQIFRLLMYDFAGDRFGESIPKMEHVVCWECLAVMKTFDKFKWQVHSAQEHLRVLALSRTQEVPLSLSKLSVTPTEILSLPDSMDFKVQLESVIKEEVDDYDNKSPWSTMQQVQIEIETQDNFKIKEETLTKEQPTISKVFTNNLIKDKPPIKILVNKQFGMVTHIPIIKPQNEQFIVYDSHSKVFNGMVNIKPSQIKIIPTAKQVDPNIIISNIKTTQIKKGPTVKVKPNLIVDSRSKGNETVIDKPLNKIQLTQQLTDNGGIPSIFPTQPQLSLYEEYMQDVKLVKLNEDELVKFRNEKRSFRLFKGARFKCEACIEQFNSLKNLMAHKVLHAVISGPFQCNICLQRFPDISSRNKHFIAHFWIFQCLKCPLRYITEKSILAHIKFKHAVGFFCCRTCNAEFTTYSELKKHRRLNHVEKSSCPECNKTLANKTILRSHMLTHSLELVNCTICNKKYKKTRIQMHMASHTEDNKQKFYCAECDIVFRTESNYKNHLTKTLKHNKIESFGIKCEECNKYFAGKQSLKFHNDLVHNKPEDVFICDLCKREYLTKIQLRRHLRNSHYAKKKVCVCEICGKSFTNKASLKSHVDSHFGRRPYECQDCGDTFTHSAARYLHRRFVHKVKKKSEIRELKNLKKNSKLVENAANEKAITQTEDNAS